jgi:uncharacterized protein (DUF924 family)
MNEIEDVLTFWLDPFPTSAAQAEERKAFWFGGNADLDRQIRERFGPLVERARSGELDAWTTTLRGTLALTILIDQFSRNLHRGTPQAFSADHRALDIVARGYDAGSFDGATFVEDFFLAMPFRHAEEVEPQKRGVALAVRAALRAPPELLDLAIYSVDWARKHLDVIVRFGRFPHRNAAMGRASTPEEVEYLAYLKAAGQWL